MAHPFFLDGLHLYPWDGQRTYKEAESPDAARIGETGLTSLAKICAARSASGNGRRPLISPLQSGLGCPTSPGVDNFDVSVLAAVEAGQIMPSTRHDEGQDSSAMLARQSHGQSWGG